MAHVDCKFEFSMPTCSYIPPGENDYWGLRTRRRCAVYTKDSSRRQIQSLFLLLFLQAFPQGEECWSSWTASSNSSWSTWYIVEWTWLESQHLAQRWVVSRNLETKNAVLGGIRFLEQCLKDTMGSSSRKTKNNSGAWPRCRPQGGVFLPPPVYSHTHAHTHAHAHAHTHRHTHTHTHTCTRTRAHMHTRTHAHTNTHTHAQTHMHAHSCKDAHTGTGTHAHAHTQMHVLRTSTCEHSHGHIRAYYRLCSPYSGPGGTSQKGHGKHSKAIEIQSVVQW